MSEGKGFFGKLFGRKKEQTLEEIPRRIEPRTEEVKREEDEPGKLYLKARKWREDQQMNEPLVKRDQFKKKY